MNVFRCDVCGKETKINPKTEFILDDKGEKKMTSIKTMDYNTMEVIEQKVYETRDLEPRCYIVKLNAGPQIIQKDFCEEHYKEILPKINDLWRALEAIGVK